jgi:hypothetical protein
VDQQVTVRRPLPAGVEAGLPQNRHAAADNGRTHHLSTHIHRHITAGHESLRLADTTVPSCTTPRQIPHSCMVVIVCVQRLSVSIPCSCLLI